MPINMLKEIFHKEGNRSVVAACNEKVPLFSAEDWQGLSFTAQEKIISSYRLAYLSTTRVNWCPALGTVLANEEVQGGVSERGGHPVVQKEMLQWKLRMTAYADRLLAGLEELDWPNDIKEIQCNWIGKSVGASVIFTIKDNLSGEIEVFTTRLDTIFGVSYLAIAPEHPFVKKIIAWQTAKQEELENIFTPLPNTYFGKELKPVIPHPLIEKFSSLRSYVDEAKNRNERTRMQSTQKVLGVFTGLYALHPFTRKPIPIWVADYVLPEYGTGAIMGVPAHDHRDYTFARYFQLPIIKVVEKGQVNSEVYEGEEGRLINSDFANNLPVKTAQKEILKQLVKKQKGKAVLFYRLRDPIFSRQRYWGEPFPIYYKGTSLML